MEQRSNDVAAKDAQIMPSTEECVGGMGQRSNDATLKNAQMYLSKEECAGGTGHIAMHKMHLLRLDQNSR